MRSLNRFYRKLNKTTDVLSFSQIEGGSDSIESDTLGDIVVSLDRVAVQARRYKVTQSRELLRLLIHGVLHLFGYDHVGVSAKEANKMREIEDALVRRYSPGISLM